MANITRPIVSPITIPLVRDVDAEVFMVSGSVSAPTGFALTDIASGRLFQRTKALTTGPVSASGTYSGGTPSAIELQVLLVADNSVVKDWTTATGSIASGNWSGTIAGVPQGGSYYLKARPANATGLAATGSNPFFVGIMIATTGQSNMNGLYSQASSPPAAAAGTTYYNGTAWAAVPAANGVRELLNAVRSASGVPVGILNHAQNGVNLSTLMEGDGSGVWTTMAAQITAVGDVEFVLFLQGEGDAAGTASGIPNWVSNLSTYHQSFATLTGRTKAQIPFIVAGLGRHPGGGEGAGNWDLMQGVIFTAGTTNPSMVYSHSNIDAPLLGDNIHYDFAGQAANGRRFARAINTSLGVTSGLARWGIASSAVVSATVTRVELTHGLGTDFTPTSGITGFEVSGDNGANWVSATGARVDADTIDLTHSSLATNSNRKLRLHYDLNPDISAPALDNSAYAVPITPSGGVLSPTPLAALPVPTFQSAFQLTDAGANKTATGKGIGAADTNRMVIAAIIGNGTAVPTSVTFTPNSGSPVVATQALNRPASGPDVMFYQAIVPTGTTVDITAAFASNPFANYNMALWTVDSATLNSTTAASATAARANSGVTSIGTDLNVQAGGFILAVAYMNAFSGNSGTITGEAPESFASRYSASAVGGWSVAADASGTTANAANTITATFTLNTAALAVAAIHYR